MVTFFEDSSFALVEPLEIKDPISMAAGDRLKIEDCYRESRKFSREVFSRKAHLTSETRAVLPKLLSKTLAL